jgi:hypothetical protein
MSAAVVHGQSIVFREQCIQINTDKTIANCLRTMIVVGGHRRIKVE